MFIFLFKERVISYIKNIKILVTWILYKLRFMRKQRLLISIDLITDIIIIIYFIIVFILLPPLINLLLINILTNVVTLINIMIA